MPGARLAADERTRIAGELDDVIAHALSAMTVQAAGARRLLLSRPALAGDAFLAIETAGSEALDELRRLLSVLPHEGELHDLVAQAIRAMVLQAGGARRLVERDPARALRAAAGIERNGRRALGDMRQALAILGSPEARPALAPQPRLAEVGELVARARAAGLPTALELRGERRRLPVGIDLAAYRIVQEALSDALQHAAGAPATVSVEWGEHALALEVRDGRARAPDGGDGLVAMRERVRLYGGELEAGLSDRGWRMRATLPLQARQWSAA